jgi:hypothetical protein
MRPLANPEPASHEVDERTQIATLQENHGKKVRKGEPGTYQEGKEREGERRWCDECENEA